MRRACIVIPTYNHGYCLADAIDSALAQTAECDIVVIDDGSTDDTAKVLGLYGSRICAIRTEHEGPSAARNMGMSYVSTEFVMFLDADDLLHTRKVEEQIAQLDAHREAGWCLCDVLVEDELARRTVTASERYGYAPERLNGWIGDALTRANIIPIMSPLIRSDVAACVRFDDRRKPEDWHFWMQVAKLARATYLPAVLATYRRHRNGRHRLPKVHRHVEPFLVEPLRLNLACGTKTDASWHPLPYMVNLDKSMGWRFEDGLGEFADGSVAGITVSHALMYVTEANFHDVFAEFARVLEPNGVLRVTEDECFSLYSARKGGWKGRAPAVTLTDAPFIMAHMARVGLRPVQMDAWATHYRDSSLCQRFHGNEPDVFFVEGIKHNALVFSPHNDDEALFAAYTIMRYRPRVVVCYPSTGDYGDPAVREMESRKACCILDASAFEQWDGTHLEEKMRALDASMRPTIVFAPHAFASHPEHIAVRKAAEAVFGARLNGYHTYIGKDKVRIGAEVVPENGWLERKLTALTQYKSQINHPRAGTFFQNDTKEYT